eukprot:Skav208333  [mRNA]  locus=scaffold1961:267572:278686:+ [translate_table: standard]
MLSCPSNMGSYAMTIEKLVDAVSRDVEWLHATLEPAAKADPFTGRLLQMSKDIHREGLKQPIMLGIHRSDYMLHEGGTDSPRFLQVELNTIASSMGAHATNVAKLHRFLLDRFACEESPVGAELRRFFEPSPGRLDHREVHRRLPNNATMQAIPQALAKAHQVYGVKDAKVVFVVNEDLRNFADWCQVEYALWHNHGVRAVQKTLAQLHREAQMDPVDGTLRLDGHEVSVVYYRSAYGPEEYPTEECWEARGKLERSKAIKCPSVDYQLVGAKKAWIPVARPASAASIGPTWSGGEVPTTRIPCRRRFLSPREAAKLRTCFAGLWGLGPEEESELGPGSHGEFEEIQHYLLFKYLSII